MLKTFEKVIAKTAYKAAVQSANTASHLGMHQMKEPCGLQELAKRE